MILLKIRKTTVKILDSVESSIFCATAELWGEWGSTAPLTSSKERKNTLFRRTNNDTVEVTS